MNGGCEDANDGGKPTPEPEQEPAQEPTREPVKNPNDKREVPKFVVFTDAQKNIRRLVNVDAIERINSDGNNRIAVALRHSQNNPGSIFTADDSFERIMEVLGATVITPTEEKS